MTYRFSYTPSIFPHIQVFTGLPLAKQKATFVWAHIFAVIFLTLLCAIAFNILLRIKLHFPVSNHKCGGILVKIS